MYEFLEKPTTESTTEHITKRPTILTTLSTIASVTIDTELPVPMETLNMSDYKQGEILNHTFFRLLIYRAHYKRHDSYR